MRADVIGSGSGSGSAPPTTRYFYYAHDSYVPSMSLSRSNVHSTHEALHRTHGQSIGVSKSNVVLRWVMASWTLLVFHRRLLGDACFSA